MFITQTAIHDGKRYEPLYLCNMPTCLADCVWSGDKSHAIDFKSVTTMNKVLYSITKYKNPTYEYGVTDG